MASSTSSLPPEDNSTSSTPLDSLISHLVAAKRSLSCVEHVSRANYLVTETRRALEHHTILTARLLFIKHGSNSQLAILGQIRDHKQSVAHETSLEFDAVISSLDAAESKLRTALDQLRATSIEPQLRPAEEAPRSLADFVDETGVETLLAAIKESIDITEAARQGFNESIEALEIETSNIKDLLSSRHEKSSTKYLQENLKSPVPQILQNMEEHAQDMAQNLESLVKHFDLCVTAIKHTEGGGAAASNITRDLPEDVRLDWSDDDGPLEPMSDDERRGMLEVLMKDVSEVEEVVNEIKEDIAEMEADFEQVVAFGKHLAEEFARTTTAFKLLEEIGFKLPNYITQSQVFIYRWDDEKAKVEDYLTDLAELRDFYAGFLLAYDKLLIEVGRRKDMEKRIAKVRQDAIAKIDKLVEEEVAERSSFKQEQGDFLPADIWPGLMTPPVRYDLVVADGSADSVPDISASIINRAIKRAQVRTKESNNPAR